MKVPNFGSLVRHENSETPLNTHYQMPVYKQEEHEPTCLDDCPTIEIQCQLIWGCILLHLFRSLQEVYNIAKKFENNYHLLRLEGSYTEKIDIETRGLSILAGLNAILAISNHAIYQAISTAF